jgi:hypothetical protein
VTLVESVDVDTLHPDEENPRQADPARLHILSLSLAKLGFVLPLYCDERGLVLSGHQRLRVAKEAGIRRVPVVRLELADRYKRGVNVLFNRTTNDFGALDTGSTALGGLDDIVAEAGALPDFDATDNSYFAYSCSDQSIVGLARGLESRYDKKGVVAVRQLHRLGIRIPIIATESGMVVNGVFRLFHAREQGETTYPVIRIPDELGHIAEKLLNYLSMDYHVDEQFARLLRHSAYRRPQNNRGRVPKAYRFWANGEKTLLDRDSYSLTYWKKFRSIHGNRLLDFGSGLSQAVPYLCTKGFEALDFEPYRLDTEKAGVPDIALSKRKAREFLEAIANPELKFDSIFLASVLNSVPFPRDRMVVLSIVHSLCSFETTVYGTCRDISDYLYEYSGIRQASYFVFDSEPGVRIGDSLTNPKIQKFLSEDETRQLLTTFWKDVETWPGGNVHYWRARAPKRVNPNVVRQALEFEFDLPYSDGSTMGLVDEAIAAWTARGTL